MRANPLKVERGLSYAPALFCSVIVALLLSFINVNAQDQKTPDRGFTPGGSYAISDIETINTTNGNVMFNIPVAALPPGRGGLSARINLFYNSKIWETHIQYRECPKSFVGTPETPECSGDPRASAIILKRVEDGGWRYGYKYELKLVENDYIGGTPSSTYNPCNDQAYLYHYKLFVVFPDGSRHEFRLFGQSSFNGYFQYKPDGTPVDQCMNNTNLFGKMVYYSVDGTYMRLEVEQDGERGNWQDNPFTIYMPDGTRVKGRADDSVPQQVIDRNGNYIEIQEISNYNNTGHRASRIVDQLGREIVLEYDAANQQDLIRQRGTNNEALMTTVKTKQITVSNTYHANIGSSNGTTNNVTGVSGSLKVVDQIILPSQSGNLSYSFSYNSEATSASSGWGEVSALTLPSGAQTTYQYKMDGHTSSVSAKQVADNSPTRKELKYLQEYDGVSTQATEVWTYSIPDSEEGGTSIITGPDGGVTKETFYGQGDGTDLFGGRVYKSERPDGTVIERLWQTNTPYNPNDSESHNAYVKVELISIANAAGALVKTAVKEYEFDKNGNSTRVSESDWLDYAILHSNSSPLWSAIQNVSFARTAINTFYVETPEASLGTDNANVYIKDSSPRLRNALSSTEVRSGSKTGTVAARSEFIYDDYATTGNLKEQRSWDSSRGPVSNPLVAATTGTANAISIKHDFDAFGNVIRTTDALGNKTEYTFGNIATPSGVVSGLYPTQTKMAAGTPVQRTSTQEFDFYTGAILRATDVDNGVSTSTQFDVFGRPKLVIAAEGKPEETRRQTVYSDMERRVVVKADLNTAGDGKLVIIKHFDQLGRVRLTRQLENAATESEVDETKGIKVQTRYKYSGTNSYQVVSNPYRAAYSSQTGSEPGMGWTLTRADQAGRIVAVETYSGYTLPTPWGSNANSTGTVSSLYDAALTTVSDQAQKTRRSEQDALGRLIKVIEDPQGLNYETTYSYDASSNLIRVAQGAQARTFSYSSLARLVAVQNPEIGQNGQGTIQYGYDDNGNLISRIDSRNIRTEYTYDALNRVTLRHYNDGVTPDVAYLYDTLPYGKGRLTSVSSAISQTSYTGYDALGRVTGSTQLTSGHTYTMPEYKYNLAGGLTSETYPSGRVVTTQYDAAGRLSAVMGQKTGEAAKTYVDSFSYTAHGAISTLKLGNNLWEHFSYNPRLQPVQIALGTTATDSSRLQLDYSYGTTDNNGNVQSQTISAPGLSLVQSYTYDQLNRLKTMMETGGLTQVYDYDRYGNRAVTAGYVEQQSITPTVQSLSSFNQNNNRIINAAYDSAGNLQSALAGHLFTYDAENKMLSHDDAQTVGVVDNQYFYDGDGHRVKKVVGSTSTIYVYDIQGEMVAEYTDYMTTQTSGTSYFTADNLGTPRVITSSEGAVISRHDYLPFGEEISVGVDGRTAAQGYVNDGVRQKFTGYERDDETGLDYAQARHYSSTMGRFTAIDPVLTSARKTDPQTWNRYAYVLNNPMRFVDPCGLQQEDSIQNIVDKVRNRPIEESGTQLATNIQLKPLTPLIATPEDLAAMAMADTMMGILTDTLRDNANQADADALAMVAEPTQAGGVNPCREALITNFGLADPTAALQALKTTGGATQMGPFGIIEGPQNVFNGNTSTASFPVDGQPLSISQFLANNPSVSAATVGNNVFLDDSFNNRGRLGRAQDMIHEAVVHRANGRSDSEFAPANSTSPKTAGSNRINEIIRANCNRLPN